jgi:MSHA biogenesis protein MshN
MADLESGLPSAGGSPDYHGFYAALLQRAQRHDEAVAQYVIALRGDPAMPTWLVGIGISLQALNRPPEALAAFQRARDGGRLSASLQDFVNGRIEQLRR